MHAQKEHADDRLGYIYREDEFWKQSCQFNKLRFFRRTVLYEIHSHCETGHNSFEGIIVRSRVQRYICETNKFIR